MKRINVKEILKDEKLREGLMVRCIQATQAREGITTTLAQAFKAYQKVRKEREESS